MPAPVMFAHRILRKMAELRHAGVEAKWLRPDCKSQVALRYENGKMAGIENVVVSTQHTDAVSHSVIKDFVVSEVIKPSLPADMLSSSTEYLVNPSGRFVIGGPQGDSGLTGRKIIVDTYGGWGRHGGGAFSGKDPSKVARSAAYMCRWVAKNIVFLLTYKLIIGSIAAILYWSMNPQLDFQLRVFKSFISFVFSEVYVLYLIYDQILKPIGDINNKM